MLVVYLSPFQQLPRRKDGLRRRESDATALKVTAGGKFGLELYV